MKPPPLLRSALYVPATNSRAIDKARLLDSDAVIVDLEDAVAPDAKETARGAAVAVANANAFGSRQLVIRANGLDTPWGREDLKAAAQTPAAAVLVPKINGAADIEAIDDLVRSANPALQVWAMIETCEAIFSLREIAASAARTRLSCFVVGTNDLVKELRATHMPSRTNLSGMLAQTVAAARLAGIAVLDGVYNAIADSEGFAAECRQGRDFGFDGKTLIHPSQIAPCHEAFSPSEAAVADARQVSEAFALPENQGAGVIKVDGRMVERLHLAIAEDVLAKASLISERFQGEAA